MIPFLRRRVASLLLVMSILPAASLRAQSDEPGFAERVLTRRYLVDVVVRNRDGSAATDLTKDDFDVRVDGRPREVLTLDRGAPGWGAPEDPATRESSGESIDPQSPTPGRRWVAILLDADRIPLNYREEALTTARDVIENNRASGTDFAVVLLKGGRAEYLLPFMPAEDIDTALFDRTGILLGTSTDLSIRIRELTEMTEDCARVREDYSRLQACVRRSSREFLFALRQETEQGLTAMGGIISALAPLPGRKALVWLSGGFTLRPADVVLESLREFSNDAAEAMRSYLQDDPPVLYEDVVRQATQAGVSVFALRTGRDLASSFGGVDRTRAAGETSRSGLSAYREASAMVEESLIDAARATGGRAVLSELRPRVTEGLFEALDGVYTLGLAALPEDGAAPRIKAKVGGPYKVEVVRRLQRPTRLVRPIAGLLQVEPPSSGSAGAYAARLDLEPDTVPVGGPDDPVSRVATYFRLTDGDGELVTDVYQIVEFPREDGAAGTLIHRFPFRPEPGRPYTAQAFVADIATGAKGVFSTSFSLPAAR